VPDQFEIIRRGDNIFFFRYMQAVKCNMSGTIRVDLSVRYSKIKV